MNERRSGEASALGDTGATVRNAARSLKSALDNGQPPGQWKVILGDLVREAPLPSLALAFMLGLLISRR